VTGDGFSFTASPWTSAELAAAAHPVDLPAPGDRCRLVLDLAEHGIGTASCGPGVLPQYRLEARPVRATLAFAPL
jgi:beta-galactosidase